MGGSRFFVPGLVLVCLLGAPSAGRAQLQKNEYQQQQEFMARFEPAPILAPAPPGGRGASATVRVRFYADDEYRSSGGGGRWQERVRASLALLNKVVEPSFGIRFEGESFRRWPRQGSSGALHPMLEQLEKLDAGPDVDWVIGLVSPLPLVSMSFHDLGVARVLGKHFVLRGMASIAELDDFKRLLPKLEQSDREQLYTRRKTHKELSIFLHEWAHTLGGLHVQDITRIMGPSYSNQTSTFSVEDATLIAAGLDVRLDARGKDTIDWTPLRKILDDTPGDWLRSDREALRGQLAAAQAQASANRVPTLPIPGLGLPGRPRPTGTFQPRPGERLQDLIGQRAPGEPREEPAGQARSGDLGGQRAAAGLATSRPPRPIERGPVGEARKLIARGELTAASRALAAAGQGSDVLAAAGELQEARRRLGIPAKKTTFSLAPEAEAEYAATVEEAIRFMRARKTREAQLALDRGLKQHPGAPGLLVVQCELLLRQSKPRAAARPCSDALEIMEDLPQAHYLLGCIYAETGEPDRGITSLKRAIEIDPNDRKVWDALGQLYRALGRADEYSQFAGKHGM